ncbi:MAG: hypothetical protein Q9160_003615 [Pyrenula sp. 1 TL-2023]
MDLFNLLDHFIMHETTHINVPTNDNGIDTYNDPKQTKGGALDVAGRNGYTWKNVANDLIGGSNNADSITFFAQGVDLLVNHNTMPQQDGSMVPAQSLLSSGAQKLRRMIESLWKA